MDFKKHGKALYQWYHELPAWAKGVMIIGSAGVAVYSVHAVIKSINDKKAKEKAQADVIGFVNDLNALAKNGVVPSFQQSQYQSWAAAIVQQFAGCDPSTVQCPDWLFDLNYSDSGKVVANIIAQFANDADFLALQAAFGLRTYDACGIWNGDVTNVTLSGAINDELEICEVEGLNKVLAAKNINYKF